MTSRRSLQTFTERLSRQTQFVPGHVGGRVASAQPVARRRGVGQMMPIPSAATGYTYWSDMPDGTGAEFTSIDLPIAPAIGQTVLALVAVEGYTGISVPSGWTPLASGTAPYGIRWQIASLDSYSSQALSFPISDSGGGTGWTCAGYVVTGVGGGAWHVLVGDQGYGAPGYLTYVTPDPGWSFWGQISYTAREYSGNFRVGNSDHDEAISPAGTPLTGGREIGYAAGFGWSLGQSFAVGWG